MHIYKAFPCHPQNPPAAGSLVSKGSTPLACIFSSQQPFQQGRWEQGGLNPISASHQWDHAVHTASCTCLEHSLPTLFGEMPSLRMGVGMARAMLVGVPGTKHVLAKQLHALPPCPRHPHLHHLPRGTSCVQEAEEGQVVLSTHCSRTGATAAACMLTAAGIPPPTPRQKKRGTPALQTLGSGPSAVLQELVALLALFLSLSIYMYIYIHMLYIHTHTYGWMDEPSST